MVRGEIDISNAERFAAVLHAAIEDSVRIVDLAEVTFMSVAASAALAQVAMVLRDRGERLALVNVSAPVMRVLSVVDFAGRTGAEIIPAKRQREDDILASRTAERSVG